MAAAAASFVGPPALQLRFVRVGADSRGDAERARRRFWWGRARAKWGCWSFRRFAGGEKLAADEAWNVGGGGARAAGDGRDVRGADELPGDSRAAEAVCGGV